MPLVCHTSCFFASSRVSTSLLRYAPGSGLRTKPSPPSATAPPSLPPKPVYTPMHNSGLVCAPAFDYSDRSASARIACAEHLTLQSKISPAPSCILLGLFTLIFSGWHMLKKARYALCLCLFYFDMHILVRGFLRPYARIMPVSFVCARLMHVGLERVLYTRMSSESRIPMLESRI